jgi:electron transport complex protein RnfG
MKYLVDAWLVIFLGILFGGALAFIHTTLDARIKKNQLDETLSQIPSLVPGACKGEKVEVPGLAVFKGLKADGATAGWVLQARGQGFADVIQVLVGVDAKADAITGLYVLEQKETPGLGDNITKEKWREQFKGKGTTAPLSAVVSAPSGSQVKAVTGATISSVSVCEIVNEAVAKFREKLVELEKK